MTVVQKILKTLMTVIQRKLKTLMTCDTYMSFYQLNEVGNEQEFCSLPKRFCSFLK